MPVHADWSLTIDVDAVLRGQGADPVALRARSPRLVEAAERALEEGKPLLIPQVLYERLPVQEIRHEQVHLHGGKRLQGALPAQHLAGAREVAVVICTIGPELEARSSALAREDIVYGLALDGVGSAGVEALANAVCASFEAQARETGQQTTIPLSPGMVGWPVEQGQPQIFGLLDSSKIGVRLSPSMLMIPRKSLTFAVGFGQQMSETARTCDYCSLKGTCRYQDHYV
jgi:hypothetical protein